MGMNESNLIARQDKLLSFGETGSITSAGTYPCGGADGKVLDMFNGDTNPKATIAKLDGFSVVFHVKTAAAGLTNATFKIQVCSTANGNYADAAVSRAVPVAELTADATFKVAIPKGAPTGRYVKAVVTTTGTGTAGVVEAAVDTFAGV